MSVGVKIETLRDTATPALKALRAGLRPSQLNPIVGRAARNTVRSHLFGLNSARPNALGGRRTNFYAGAARGTQFQSVADGVIVSINQIGIAQRYFGGTIRPRMAKFLAIPARAEAHGKRPREFNDLHVLFGRDGPYALARNVRQVLIRRRQRDGATRVLGGAIEGGEIMFWLKKEVTQQPDHGVLPTNERLTTDINRELDSYIKRLTDRQGGNS